MLGLLGIVLGDITGLLGLGCSPITVVGVGSGNACSANAVCCTNNDVVSAILKYKITAFILFYRAA